FGPDGTLTRGKPGADGDVDSYRPDPDARPKQTLPASANAWARRPPYDWRPYVDGTALAYATPPLDEDLTIVGPGSVGHWLRSGAPDSDLQVTLREIRPDGQEMYVQSGWLRASLRKLSTKRSTRLEPRPTYLEQDAKPLPAGKFTKVRVGLFAAAHVF